MAVSPGALWSQAVVVTGTGEADVDVPAVQAAVDQGGQLVLTGHFSFDRPPTKPAGETYSRMVTVSQPVVISGSPDENGALPTIEGGFIPFYVNAPGSRVAIRGLDFIRPQGEAIWIYAASSPVIAGCRIEGVAVSAEFASYAAISNPLATAISLGANPVPNAAQGTELITISGTVSILNNDIDVGGTAADQTLGIALFGVGTSPDHEVDIYISGNNLRNITERVINLNTIGGRAHIERNVITAGATAGPSSGLPPDAITITDASSVLIAHNSIVAEWATGTGILVQGNKSESGAVVVDNDITMPAPEGTTFGANSAGIMITGFAQGNIVLNNRISGHARGALVLGAKGAGIPGNNTFVANDLGGFQSSLADVYIDAGVSNTVVVGAQSKIEDHGAATIVVPTQ